MTEPRRAIHFTTRRAIVSYLCREISLLVTFYLYLLNLTLYRITLDSKKFLFTSRESKDCDARICSDYCYL